MKVFGGLTLGSNKNFVRTIVAATSQKRAAQLVGETLGQFRQYWCETGSKTELEVALASPETVFVASSDMGKDFVAREEKCRMAPRPPKG